MCLKCKFRMAFHFVNSMTIESLEMIFTKVQTHVSWGQTYVTLRGSREIMIILNDFERERKKTWLNEWAHSIRCQINAAFISKCIQIKQTTNANGILLVSFHVNHLSNNSKWLRHRWWHRLCKLSHKDLAELIILPNSYIFCFDPVWWRWRWDKLYYNIKSIA